MGEPHWRLLGFDARETEEDCKKTPIPKEVRKEFLLRPEIKCPFSVDAHIWPTHFLYFPQIRHLIGQRQPPLIETDPDCRGGLWLNLMRMRQRLAENNRKAILVSVELLAPENTSLSEFPSSLIYSSPEPSSVPKASVLLGHDVADVGFWSGLSNCGYDPEQLVGLRPKWAKRINDSGLLPSEQDALAFKKISDERVADHAPFWVYRLCQLSSE